MEEIDLAATAYFNNCSNEILQLAWKFFQSIDTNREGRVSVDEFTNFIQNEEWNRLFHDDTGTDGDDSGSKDYAKLFKWVVDPKFFTQLDTNGDCSLDFSEFLTFLYLLSTRHVWCSGCQAYLPGLYFTCLDYCDNLTFDLCVACYKACRFSHHHSRFVDSFVSIPQPKL